MSQNNSIYFCGKCRVITCGEHRHELWFGESFVAIFTTFRAAVRYQLSEFP